MAVTVRIPTPLLKATGGNQEVTGAGETVASVLKDIEAQYPELTERMRDETGNLRRFINLYLNEEDIRFLDGEETLTADGDELSIIPAIAGG